MAGYNIETYNYDNQVIFEDKSIINATYIIHLKNNGRYDSIINQLKIFHPTETVHLVINDGYKTSNKNLKKQNSTYDLIHAFNFIFKDAFSRNYKNILVLEDDFYFDIKIKSPIHINGVSKFIETHNNEAFMLLLGCIPFIRTPFENKGLSLGTHCAVYSQKYIEALIEKYEEIDDWDIYTNLYCKYPRYIYDTPLCYQTFPYTENSQLWGKNNVVFYIFALLLKTIFKYVKLDCTESPGYLYFYFFSKFVCVFLIFLLVYLAYKLMNY